MTTDLSNRCAAHQPILRLAGVWRGAPRSL